MTRPPESEEDLQRATIELAQVYGWRVAHFRPARTERGWRTAVAGDGKGFPDLVLVRAPELIFAELKSDTGRLRDEQRAWLVALGEVAREVGAALNYLDAHGPGVGPAAVEMHIWRPSDWPTIAERLRPSPGGARPDG